MKLLTSTAVSLLLIGLTMSGTAYSQVPAWEREALITFYNSTGGDNWSNNTGWNGAAGTECDWYGVTCTSGEITSLSLGYNNLSGSIPAELGNLTSLEYLYLNYNQLTGAIPSELGNLTILKRLNLSINRLTGSIPPQLGNLTSLEYLYLNNNELTGSIPPELPHAQYLSLWNNQLTGAIPTELQGSYMSLDLRNNQLSGSIPPGIIKMSAEASIEVSDNPKLDRNVLIKLYDSTKPSVTINDPDNRIQFESFFDEHTQAISTLGFNKVTYSVGEHNDTTWVNGKYTVEDYAFLQVQIDGSHGGKNLNNPDSPEYTVGTANWMTNASYVIENDINQDGHSDFIVWLQTFGDFNTLPGTRALQFVNDGDGHFQLDCGVFDDGICPLVFGQSSLMRNMGWFNNEDAPVKTENLGINKQYDLNGDGNKDLFNTGLLWLTENGKFVESRNNLPDFMFENLNADGVDVGIYVHDHAVGDLNGDGFNDIFMPNAVPVRSQNNGMKFFMLNDGNGDFKDFSFKVGHNPDFATSTIIADFDGDGFGDIALGWSRGAYVGLGGDSVGGIYWGNADMDYTRDYTALPEGYFETNIAWDMAATDVNADGLLDLVISNTQDEPYYKGNVLQALTNNGDRTFTDPAFRAKEETDGVGYIYILDFNHDGVDDIVVVSDHRTYALINNGDGTYTETSQFAVPDTFSSLFPSYPVEVDGKYNYDFIGWDIVSKSQSQSISSFFISLNSPGISWTNTTGWAGDPGTECDWYGVTCTGDAVTGLNLASNNLVGTIPSELGNLTTLTSVDLSSNALTGSIPTELSNLTTLTSLDLSANSLTGPLPQWLSDMAISTLNTTDAFTAFPVVAISGGNRTIADTDNAAGESVSFIGTATDSDGTIATTEWLVGGSVVATGLSATISLPNRSTVVTFKATDNDGASSTTTATITVTTPTPTYTVTDEWPSPYNGVTPDSSLGLAFNNIGVFSASDSIIYTCLRIFTDGLPGSAGGISEFDIGLTVVSLNEATVQITKFREFNVIGALNENVELPDCSGKFETTTSVYTDIIEVGDSVLDTTWSLIDPTNLILKLSSYQELTAN